MLTKYIMSQLVKLARLALLSDSERKSGDLAGKMLTKAKEYKRKAIMADYKHSKMPAGLPIERPTASAKKASQLAKGARRYKDMVAKAARKGCKLI